MSTTIDNFINKVADAVGPGKSMGISTEPLDCGIKGCLGPSSAIFQNDSPGNKLDI